MGLDLVYVRCPQRFLELAQHERTAAESLASGIAPIPLVLGETIEDVDLGRSERYLYRILSFPERGEYWDSDSSADWVRHALLGAEVLPFGCDPNIYGPSRFLVAAAVSTIAGRLAPTNDELFRARYDALVSRDGIIRPDLGRDDFEGYLLPHFQRLRTFYTKAGDADQAVVITPT